MKKIITILLTLMMVGSLAACGNKEKTESKADIETETLSWNDYKYFTVSIDVPKEKGYELIEGMSEKSPYEKYADFTLVGERFIIAFENTSYVYQTSNAWKEAYGETDPNFDDFKKATTEKINGMSGAIEQVNGEDVVVKYTLSQDLSKYIGLTRIYNTDGIREDGINTRFSATIYVIDESVEDIDALLEEEVVKAIFDSIKIEKK